MPKAAKIYTNASLSQTIGLKNRTYSVWMVGGYTLGGPPTLRNAFLSAQSGRSGDAVASASAMNDDNGKDNSVRYINNVRTKNTGWSAVIVGKSCMEITGQGYK